MFSDPLQTELHYQSLREPIWEEFSKLQSDDFAVQLASASGHPGNVSPKSVRREVQQWIDKLDTAEILAQRYYGILPHRTFQFKNWRLHVRLDLKSREEKARLGATAVESPGFSGGWSDNPARRLKSKLEEKFSQVRKTGRHCIVAITEGLEGFSVDDVQTALLGGNSDNALWNQIDDTHPYIRDLSIPQPKTDGLWSRHDEEEPIAVKVHRGNLLYQSNGETELWLNPNGSYFRVPTPLLHLKIHAEVQRVWTGPAIGL